MINYDFKKFLYVDEWMNKAAEPNDLPWESGSPSSPSNSVVECDLLGVLYLVFWESLQQHWSLTGLLGQLAESLLEAVSVHGDCGTPLTPKLLRLSAIPWDPSVVLTSRLSCDELLQMRSRHVLPQCVHSFLSGPSWHLIQQAFGWRSNDMRWMDSYWVRESGTNLCWGPI